MTGPLTKARLAATRALGLFRRRRRSVLLVLGALALSLLAGSATLVCRPRPPDVQQKARRYPVHGIDVSHHQGAIQWPAVAKSPTVGFAWIKATEGGDFTDSRFAENAAEAERAGLWVGAYHFFTFCRPPADQAAHFLEVIATAPPRLRAAVDVEFEGNCPARPTREELQRDLGQWLDIVEAARGSRPVIYAGRDFYVGYLAGSTLRAPLWIRDTEDEPTMPWSFWQLADDARIDGIEGPVDVDVFAGDRAALERL